MADSNRADDQVIIMGCGDVGPYHEPIDGYPTLAKPVLATADLRFAHAEKVYSERGVMQVHSDGHYSRQPRRFANLLADCGFDVVSIAGNKAMDWGAEAMLDMIELLNSMGIKTVGGGRNAEEARKPAIFTVNGVRVAFLAYSSILRQGYEATEHTAGHRADAGGHVLQAGRLAAGARPRGLSPSPIKMTWRRWASTSRRRGSSPTWLSSRCTGASTTSRGPSPTISASWAGRPCRRVRT